MRAILLRIFRILSLIILLNSCSSNDEVYLYDRTEFIPSRQPSYNSQNNMAPTYYQAQPQIPPQMPQYNPYHQYPPNSRAYSNPYDFPSQGYYPYYDNERYYVAPSYYRNVEPVSNQVGSMKY